MNFLLQADDVLRQRLDARGTSDRQTLRALFASTLIFADRFETSTALGWSALAP